MSVTDVIDETSAEEQFYEPEPTFEEKREKIKNIHLPLPNPPSFDLQARPLPSTPPQPGRSQNIDEKMTNSLPRPPRLLPRINDNNKNDYDEAQRKTVQPNKSSKNFDPFSNKNIKTIYFKNIDLYFAQSLHAHVTVKG